MSEGEVQKLVTQRASLEMTVWREKSCAFLTMVHKSLMRRSAESKAKLAGQLLTHGLPVSALSPPSATDKRAKTAKVVSLKKRCMHVICSGIIEHSLLIVLWETL